MEAPQVTEVNLAAAENIVSNKVEEKLESQGIDTNESEPQVEQKPTETDDDFAHRMALLARKERMLTERQKEMKEWEEKVKRLERLEKLKDEDPDEYLKESGLTLDKLIQASLKKNTTETVEEKIARLEKMLTDKEENEKLSKKQTAEQNLRNQIKQTIESKEDYPLIKSLDEFDLVYDVMEEYWNQHNQMLPIEKAAELVENSFFEKVQSLKSIDKVKKLFAEAHETAQNKLEHSEIVKTVNPEPVTQSLNHKTLTAKSVPSTEMAQPKRLLSREESLAKIAKDLEAKMAEKKRLQANKL